MRQDICEVRASLVYIVNSRPTREGYTVRSFLRKKIGGRLCTAELIVGLLHLQMVTLTPVTWIQEDQQFRVILNHLTSLRTA